MSNLTADQKRELGKKKIGTYFGERAIDRANRNAKKTESIGYHSGKKYFKLNPNRKPTMATVKSFIKKSFAKGNLYIMERSNFDARIDCIVEVKDQKYTKVVSLDFDKKHTLGIVGAWFVPLRNYFTIIENDDWRGYNIYNCCANFNLVEKK